jgi:hypothetical protein
MKWFSRKMDFQCETTELENISNGTLETICFLVFIEIFK